MGIDLWSGLVGAMTGGCLFQIAFKNIFYFVCITDDAPATGR